MKWVNIYKVNYLNIERRYIHQSVYHILCSSFSRSENLKTKRKKKYKKIQLDRISNNMRQILYAGDENKGLNFYYFLFSFKMSNFRVLTTK